MSEVRYRVCDNCGAKIKKLYWNVQLSKMDADDVDVNFSQESTSLDLCEGCKFKLERQLNKIKSPEKEQKSTLRR